MKIKDCKIIAGKIKFMHANMIEFKVHATLYFRMHRTHANGMTNQSRTKLSIPRFRVKKFNGTTTSEQEGGFWHTRTQRTRKARVENKRKNWQNFKYPIKRIWLYDIQLQNEINHIYYS